MDAFEEDRVPDIFRCRAALDRLPADVSMAVNAPWRVRSENCLRKVCSKFEVDPEQILELAAEPVGVTLLTM